MIGHCSLLSAIYDTLLMMDDCRSLNSHAVHVNEVLLQMSVIWSWCGPAGLKCFDRALVVRLASRLSEAITLAG